MRIAVEFDDQPRLRAIEIRDEWPNRMLPAELEAVELAIAEQFPELDFGGSAIATHGAGESKETRIDHGHKEQMRRRPSP